MSNPNPIKVATKIAETKYKDNIVIKSLLDQFLFCKRMFEFRMETKDLSETIFNGYKKGFDGEDGYGSSSISKELISTIVGDKVRKLTELSVVQAKAECLIMALQALGEEIDY